MYCPSCGVLNQDGTQSRSSCGKPLIGPAASMAAEQLAIASLVLGATGILYGLTSIPGLVLGIISLWKIRQSGGRLKGKGLAIAGVVTSAATLVMASLLIAAVMNCRERPPAEPTGRTSLHNIGIAIAKYRDHNNGEYPPDLLVLLNKDYLDSREALLDPRDTTPQLIGPEGLRCSFEYVGAIPASTPEEVIIAYSRRGVHAGGRNVLHADIAVEWADAENLYNPGGNLRTSLRASYEAVVKAFGDKLTKEREAELQKFYEVQD